MHQDVHRKILHQHLHPPQGNFIIREKLIYHGVYIYSLTHEVQSTHAYVSFSSA